MYQFFQSTGLDPKFFTSYLLGLLTIVLYAKEKFNTPTYDKESMGPFSALPPQFLTIDARYRQGLLTYVLLLLSLYTALCIIGPSTFSQQGAQLGFSADSAQLWPAASATFLISTGAARDSSILGKIEHFVRQYSQRSAYIPSIVNSLAFAIRNVETGPWLKENSNKLAAEEFDSRKAALTSLIGDKYVAELNQNPGQQGHFAAWARANIVFYCLQQMFRGNLSSERLGQITETQENAAIFERLRKQRDELQQRFVDADNKRNGSKELPPGVFDQLLGDIQRFSKEVSLAIVILLSQAARTFSDLKDRLEQLGFRSIELPERSDHLVYLVMVNFSILFGALVSYAVTFFLADLATTFHVVDSTSTTFLSELAGGLSSFVRKSDVSNQFSIVNHVGEIVVLVTGALVYMICFKVIDYLRDGYLDQSEWRESLQGYVPVVVVAGFCSALLSVLVLVLLLSPVGLLGYVWTDLAGLGQQLLFQLCIAGLASGFAVAYLRNAVRVSWRDDNAQPKRLLRIVFEEFFFFRSGSDFVKLVHGILAASLVGALTYAIITHERNNMIAAASSSLDDTVSSFNQNQGWLVAQVKQLPNRSPTAIELKKDLSDIPCNLRDMYAAVHVFDVGKQYIQFDSDFVQDEGPPSPARSAPTPLECKESLAKGVRIPDEIKQVSQICSTLNRIGMQKSSPPRNSPPPGAAAQTASPMQRLLVPTLFMVPERCELNQMSTEDPDEQNFRALGNSLFQLHFSLDSLNRVANGVGQNAAIFPMFAAFFIAYMFGAGCRVWRSWWLHDDVALQEIAKLREQIERIYQRQTEPRGFEDWLKTPLGFLNNVAPKEAIRYEGPKARLYAKIESRQVDLDEASVPIFAVQTPKSVASVAA